MTELLTQLTDEELEQRWQAQANMIQTLLMKYYSNGDESLRTQAGEAQARQQQIQNEITRRYTTGDNQQ